MLKSMFVAFAMYSKIPVPIFDWEEKNMRYALGFFPLVGVVIGIVYMGVFKACDYMQWGGLLKGALLTAVPVIITGGIHADGYIDTVDALSSYGSVEKRLEILKDPHVGAFGIIWTVVYFILYVGFSSELNYTTSFITACGFVLSRASSGTAVLGIKGAKKDGLLYTFTSTSSREVVRGTLIIIAFLSVKLMVDVSLASGLGAVLSEVILLFLFRPFCVKNFGGITGDLAGFFLQVSELLILMAAVIGGGLK